jgi:hypothetical protein
MILLSGDGWVGDAVLKNKTAISERTYWHLLYVSIFMLAPFSRVDKEK